MCAVCDLRGDLCLGRLRGSVMPPGIFELPKEEACQGPSARRGRSSLMR